MDASAPAVWGEVCRAGIESDKPITLAFRPILARNGEAKGKSVLLPPGKFRLCLLLLDPDSTAPGQRVFDVRVADAAADRVDTFQRAGGARRVVAVVYSVAVGSAGVVNVVLTPVKGKAILCGAVLEPEQLSHLDLPAPSQP
jgi:hypothetical protein